MAKVVIVTGGIGSGKSEVCKLLARMGYVSQYDADSRVKKLYTESADLVPELEAALGMSLRDGNGVFVPSLMAARIFTDRKALETVESFVFPALEQDFDRFVRESSSPSDIVIFESATVLEKEYFSSFGDAVILVTAPYQVRLHRAMNRDKAGCETVKARMDNQKLMNALSEFADTSSDVWQNAARISGRITAVIDTDCTIDQMKERITSAIEVVKTKLL